MRWGDQVPRRVNVRSKAPVGCRTRPARGRVARGRAVATIAGFAPAGTTVEKKPRRSGAEAVSIRRRILIQRRLHPRCYGRAGRFKFLPNRRTTWTASLRLRCAGRGPPRPVAQRRTYAARLALGADDLRRRCGRGANARVGEAHDLLRRLLELVERGGRSGERRLERVDGDIRAGRRRLARLFDPRGDALRVRRPRFFGERREFGLRFRRQLVQRDASSRSRLARRASASLARSASSSCTSLTDGGGLRAFDALRERGLGGVQVEVARASRRSRSRATANLTALRDVGLAEFGELFGGVVHGRFLFSRWCEGLDIVAADPGLPGSAVVCSGIRRRRGPLPGCPALLHRTNPIVGTEKG